MKKHNLLVVIFLSILLTSCFTTKEHLYAINTDKLKAQYTQDQLLLIDINNPDGEKIDSVLYQINQKKIGSVKNKDAFSYNLKDIKFGAYSLKAFIYSDGDVKKDSTQIEVISSIQPKIVSYTVVNTYPHDVEAYTEGLEFYNGFLYEGTGNGTGNSGKKGISSLRKVDYKTGKVLQKVDYPEAIFGEGITFINNKLYQLTYKQNEVYVYDIKTLTKEKTMSYYKTMEGWGMTNNGKNIYYNDGSETIHIVNPNTFKQVDSLKVYSGATKVPNINELEWVDGKIYSNIYQKDAVLIINGTTGAVESILDFADLTKKVTKLIDTDVINGIAYNASTKTFFVTGKNWDKMFEIKINQ